MGEIGEIKVNCCEGNELYQGHCVKWRCSIYKKAKESMKRSHPYVGTGFGNLYGNLDHQDYLSRVREHFRAKKNLEKKKEA